MTVTDVAFLACLVIAALGLSVLAFALAGPLVGAGVGLTALGFAGARSAWVLADGDA